MSRFDFDCETAPTPRQCGSGQRSWNDDGGSGATMVTAMQRWRSVGAALLLSLLLGKFGAVHSTTTTGTTTTTTTMACNPTLIGSVKDEDDDMGGARGVAVAPDGRFVEE